MTKASCGTLTPAYGRDYTSPADAVAALNDGKDFRLSSPFAQGYCSIRDLEGDFQIRFNHNEDVALVSVTDGIAEEAS